MFKGEKWIIQPTIILQPLGHVDSLNVCSLLEGPHIQNELMGYKTYSDQHKYIKVGRK